MPDRSLAKGVQEKAIMAVKYKGFGLNDKNRKRCYNNYNRVFSPGSVKDFHGRLLMTTLLSDRVSQAFFNGNPGQD